MNIKVNSDGVQNKRLNENQQNFQPQNNQQKIQQKIQQLVDTSQEEIVMKNKSKQFQFDCGVIMARIDTDVNSKFGLKYHFLNSASFDAFLISVEKIIKISGNELTKNDINNLQKQFKKANSK